MEADDVVLQTVCCIVAMYAQLCDSVRYCMRLCMCAQVHEVECSPHARGRPHNLCQSPFEGNKLEDYACFVSLSLCVLR